jgi:hypothetical protein
MLNNLGIESRSSSLGIVCIIPAAFYKIFVSQNQNGNPEIAITYQNTHDKTTM